MAKIIAASTVILAAYFPTAFWLGHNYVPTPQPAGGFVIPLLKIEREGGHMYRSSALLPAVKSENDFVLYEGLMSLGPAQFMSHSGRRYVMFSASDNSDPTANGRTYWLVLPPD